MLEVVDKEVRIYLKGYRASLEKGNDEEFFEEGNVINVNEVGIELLSDGFFHQFFPWTSIEHISWDDEN